MKKILPILLCILLLLCSCEATIDIEGENIIGAYAQKEEKEEKQDSLNELTMLYYPDMDINPITTTCLANHELLKFIYSPLIAVNSVFEPSCVLAQSFSQNANVVTVKIRQGIVFSNGEAVSANDVVKSYRVAKNDKNSPYHPSTERMKKFYALDATTFVCEFDSVDVDCVNLLDIPIMQDGKAGIGCGAYIMTQQNGKPVLLPNDNYFEKASVPVIHLTETKSDDYIDDLFAAGALDVMIAGGTEDLKLTSLRDYQIVSCPSNKLVYIGVNFKNPVFADVSVRRALSVVTDRQTLTSQSLVDLATPTEYPFNPNWGKMKSVKLAEHSDDEILAAQKILSNINLTLVVPNSGYKQTIAAELAASYKAIGLTLNVRELDAAAYTQAIVSGDYDLYLGETMISRNMDPTELYKTNGALNFSGYNDFNLDMLFLQYKSGEITLDKYLEGFNERLPIIPILYVKNVLYCANGINSFSGRSAFSAYGNGAGLTLK